VIKIREGRLEDLEAIAGFSTDTFAWGDYIPEVYADWLQTADGAVMVAVGENDRAVGLVRARLVSAQEGWISGARVAAELRRQGVGSQLNHAAADWLAEQGALVARLTTEEDNDAARAQVTKLGYRGVAAFIHGHRAFSNLGKGANGGKRLPAPERFDLAPAAEAEPAFVSYSSGELARAGHGLFAPETWDFRKLRHDDVVGAAKRRSLWTSPSGWAVTRLREDGLWIGLLVTSADDVGMAARALVDLAREQQVDSMELMVPRIGWLEEALTTEGVELGHANVVYERALR
jgi:ribosomal protein S18 acetylase RimI-like enzyme